MQNYEELLNNPVAMEPVSVQGIYDIVYAKEITSYTLTGFCYEMEAIGRAILHNGIRTMVHWIPRGGTEVTMSLSLFDPQLREVMVIALRMIHHSRGNDILRDYAHLEINPQRLYGQSNLLIPGTQKRAGDLKELATAIREYLHLYE